MESANGTVAGSASRHGLGVTKHARISVFLRFLAFSATLSAAIVMGFNRQTVTMIVGLGNAQPLYGNVTAKFHQTPAFVFFVIANGIAAVYALATFLLSLGMVVGGSNKVSSCTPTCSLLLALGDLVMVALVSAGGAAAASVAKLAESGDQHARWNAICDQFDVYCRHGGGALIASFLGVLFLMNLNVLSTLSLYKLANSNNKM